MSGDYGGLDEFTASGRKVQHTWSLWGHWDSRSLSWGSGVLQNSSSYCDTASWIGLFMVSLLPSTHCPLFWSLTCRNGRPSRWGCKGPVPRSLPAAQHRWNCGVPTVTSTPTLIPQAPPHQPQALGPLLLHIWPRAHPGGERRVRLCFLNVAEIKGLVG